ncbi:MAG: methionine synthase [Proteobacteria bacterium]|nr:methionine synthase [Pseudomonadota bacterium]
MEKLIKAGLAHRVLVLDGAMGTMIQRRNLTESDYRGSRYANHACALKGNHDVLALTCPDVICDIHCEYIRAGSDIIETNTFGANQITQEEYGLAGDVIAMNEAAVRLAKKAVQIVGRPCLVAGSIGPTNTSLSIASDVDHPELRKLGFDEFVAAYEQQIRTLLDAGIDLILIETAFDVLNAKAALYAAQSAFQATGTVVPIMVSASLADQAGRLLCGQELEAFVQTIAAFHPAVIGLNCGFGVLDMERFLPVLAKSVPDDIAISCYPNAGLPDSAGAYHDSPEYMAQKLAEFVQNGWLNIVGGCCGTTPEHIRAIAGKVRDIDHIRPLKSAKTLDKLDLCGLGTIDETGRMVIAERANVTGSRRFKRLIEQKKWDEALDVTRSQMKQGAQLIDICMDSVEDAPLCMREFLRRMNAEPWISRYPVVLDSSDFEVIRVGLRECQGRCLVNSISLKNGEDEFLQHAREIHALGAAVVIMAFDEKGQASTTERRVSILSRAIRLLLERANFRLSDIVVDPNILAIGTGLEEHANQAVSFIETCRLLRERFPGIHTSGGLSNLSFSFRGRDDVRAAIHTAFLRQAGSDLTMVIANPATMSVQSDPELARLADNLVACRGDDALENLLEWMKTHAPEGDAKPVQNDRSDALLPEERLKLAFIHGISKHLEDDMKALSERLKPLQIIEGPLMDAMNEVGERFGRGEMFLPQIVKAARMMKQAIACLPIPQTEHESTRKKILLATVFGDVHDIGKNIVGIVLSCSGYEVIDLGVMVETQRIVEAARDVDAIGLSGLISPSLGVMVDVAKALNDAGIRVPLFVGGAAANDAHAALHLAPAYAPGHCCHIADASKVPGVLKEWLSPETQSEFIRRLEEKHAHIRMAAQAQNRPTVSIAEARKLAPVHTFSPELTAAIKAQICQGLRRLTWTTHDLYARLDWAFVERTLAAKTPETRQLLRQQSHLLCRHADETGCLQTQARLIFLPACRSGDDIVLPDSGTTLWGIRVQQENLPHDALADWIPESDGGIGLFALSTSCDGMENLPDIPDVGLDGEHIAILAQTLAAALVEAANVTMHEEIVRPLGNYICPAPGYPISPDHSLKKDILRLTRAHEIGISLTPGFMMQPLASICGMTIVHPEARYFHPGRIERDQWGDMATRRNMDIAELMRICGQ